MLVSSSSLSDQELEVKIEQFLLIISSTDQSASTLFSLSIDHIAFFTKTTSEIGIDSVNIVYVKGSTNSNEQQPVTIGTFKFTTQSNNFNQFIQLHPTFTKLCRNYSSSSSSSQRVDMILNTCAGASDIAKDYTDNVVIPLLNVAGILYRVTQTEAIGDAGKALKRLKESEPTCSSSSSSQEQYAVIVVGGDGTTHELINDLLLKDDELVETVEPTNLILLPFGTANALYYHLFPPESLTTPVDQLLSPLYSLLAFLRNGNTNSTPLLLSVALNTLTLSSPASSTSTSSSSDSSKSIKVITSVVSSAALHASILHDAESLRSSHPGVERFKLAAQQNSTTWYDGKLTLLASDELGEGGGEVEKYDSSSRSLVKLSSIEERILEGPFCYVVSSLVSRFESNFVVAPLRSNKSSLAPSTPSIDLVIIRPLRDSITSNLLKSKSKTSLEVAQNYVGTVWNALGGMYKGGSHIDEKYENSEMEIVEYLRCTGFIWEPTPSDDKKSNLVCLDGALHDLGKGGRLKTKALGIDQSGLRVWA